MGNELGRLQAEPLKGALQEGIRRLPKALAKLPGCADVEGHGGDPFHDKYFIADLIAEGRHSEVYSCWLAKDTSKRYAIKIIKSWMPENFAKLREEVHILWSLSGGDDSRWSLPIVALKDQRMSTLDDGGLEARLVLEVCDLGTVGQWVAAHGPYEEEDVKILACRLASALKYLHAQDIIHQNIQPENALLCSQPGVPPGTWVKLSGFGLATQSTNHSAAAVSRESGLHNFFKPPESLRRNAKATPEGDIWSFGVLLLYCLCGAVPCDEGPHGGRECFPRDGPGRLSASALWSRIVERGSVSQYLDRSPMSDSWNSLSKAAQTFVEQLLRLDPTKRLTAEEILHHRWLRSAVSVLEVTSVDAQRFEPTSRRQSDASCCAPQMGSCGMSGWSVKSRTDNSSMRAAGAPRVWPSQPQEQLVSNGHLGPTRIPGISGHLPRGVGPPSSSISSTTGGPLYRQPLRDHEASLDEVGWTGSDRPSGENDEALNRRMGHSQEAYTAHPAPRGTRQSQKVRATDIWDRSHAVATHGYAALARP